MSDQGGRVADSELPDLMDPEVQQCPYGLYQTLRHHAPLYRMPSTGFHLVTSYESVSYTHLTLPTTSPV